ncbi:unnamed protein product, partial [Allacma fusca]
MMNFGSKWKQYLRKQLLWCHYVGCLPIEWDHHEECPKVIKSSFRKIVSWCSIVVFLIHEMKVLFNTVRLAMSPDWEKLKFGRRVFMVTMTLENVFGVGLYIHILNVSPTIPILFKQFVRFHQNLEGHQVQGSGFIPAMFYYLTASTLLCIPMVARHFEAQPQLFHVITPVNSVAAITTLMMSFLALTWVTVVRTTLIFTGLFALTLPALVIAKSGANSLLENSINAEKQAIQSTSRHLANVVYERTVAVTNFIENYRATEVLVTTLNAISSGLGPLAQTTSVVVISGSIVCSIRMEGFYKKMAGVAIIVINSAMSMLFNYSSGSIYEKSKESLAIWKRRMNYTRIQKTLKSIRPIKIYCGSWFYYDKEILLPL